MGNSLKDETERGRLPIRRIAPKIRNGSAGAQRGFIVGRSGSGKSYLAKNLLAVYGASQDHEAAYRGYLVVVDPNGTFDFPTTRITEEIGGIRPGKSYPVITYRPSPQNTNAVAWNEFWRVMYHLPAKDGLMVYIDELYAMEPIFGKQDIAGEPNWFTTYITRGRARQHGAIMVAQRPASIPMNIIGNADHFYVFDLPTDEDRDRMTKVIGRFSEDGEDLRNRRTLHKYEFWYSGSEEDPHRMRIV